MKHEFLKTPEGKYTDFKISFEQFQGSINTLKQDFSKFTELRSINIKVSKTDIFFLNELSNKEGVSKNTLLEYCIENSIEKFLLTLDTYARRTLINYFEAIYDCEITNNRLCFINSWNIHMYYSSCIQMINQIDGTARGDGEPLPTSPMSLLIEKKLQEFPIFLNKIKILREDLTKSDNAKLDSPISENSERMLLHQNTINSNFLKNRLDMMLLMENQKNSVENHDFQIVTFRSNFKIISMMEMISHILNIPMNQLFFESISEVIADISCQYDSNCELITHIIYKIEKKELELQGFINILINKGYIQYREGSGDISQFMDKNKISIEKIKNKTKKETKNLKVVKEVDNE